MAILDGMGRNFCIVLYQDIYLPLSAAYFRGDSLLETNPLLCYSLYDFDEHLFCHTSHDAMHADEEDLGSFNSRQVCEFRSGEFCSIL